MAVIGGGGGGGGEETHHAFANRGKRGKKKIQ